MPALISQIESILFVASKPLSIKKIAKVLAIDEDAVEKELKVLQGKYDTNSSGVVLFQTNSEFQLVAHPENRTVAEHFIKTEISGELTRPQLETLTVISYCGPLTKPEIEQIRGVNCSLILRNLLIRGLIKEAGTENNLLPAYEVTMEYLQHLGVSNLAELPEYETLHNHEFINNTLNQIVVGSEKE
ncbi:MAG: SMC-Scp complex subunit ScpB [Patescibacteria group bacterium]|jgi:segregation and condensation protein B